MRSNFLGRRLLRCHWSRANSVYEQSSASEDSTFKIWDLSNGACLYTLDVGGSLKQNSFDASDYVFTSKLALSLSTLYVTTCQEMDHMEPRHC
jgi:WD40 repeat protein